MIDDEEADIKKLLKKHIKDFNINELLHCIYDNFPNAYKAFNQEKQDQKLIKNEIFHGVAYLQRKYKLSYEKALEESDRIKKKEAKKNKSNTLKLC